jgi:hypothetical protein
VVLLNELIYLHSRVIQLTYRLRLVQNQVVSHCSHLGHKLLYFCLELVNVLLVFVDVLVVLVLKELVAVVKVPVLFQQFLDPFI